MIATITILIITVILFIVGKVRSDIVALCALCAMLLLGILTPEEALSGFSSTVVIMMVGLFVVGGAILQTGLAKAVSQKIMKLAGGNDIIMFLLVMIVTALIGAFISNTGTVALMMPIVVSMAAQAGVRPGRLLMPLAFASSLGGMLTLIGTPPNLVIQKSLTDAGFEPLSFFSFFPVGLICIVVGIIVLLPLTRLFLYNNKGKGEKKVKGSGKTLDELVAEYSLENDMRRYKITSKSKIKGKTVAELNLRGRYGLTILEIRSEKADRSGLIRNVRQSLAGPDSILRVGDIVYLTGDTSVMDGFADTNNLERLDSTSMDFYDIGIAEIVLVPMSRLIGTLLKNSGFREKYDINVLGIKRNNNYIMNSLTDRKLCSGDVLLVQGQWTNIAKLDDEETDWVVLGQPEKQAQKVTLNYRAPLAAVIMVAMVALMVFDFIPVAPVTAVMLAGLMMVLSGCFRNVEAAYKTINWES
ncbi:MAG: SLC13 family permease, partial [Prevotella sp.]